VRIHISYTRGALALTSAAPGGQMRPRAQALSRAVARMSTLVPRKVAPDNLLEQRAIMRLTAATKSAASDQFPSVPARRLFCWRKPSDKQHTKPSVLTSSPP